MTVFPISSATNGCRQLKQKFSLGNVVIAEGKIRSLALEKQGFAAFEKGTWHPCTMLAQCNISVPWLIFLVFVTFVPAAVRIVRVVLLVIVSYSLSLVMG